MKRRVLSYLIAASMFCAIGDLSPISTAANAQVYFYLSGTYAMQFTGNVFLPAPFNNYNGPFSRNGVVFFDGAGNFQANVVANYNGTISRDVFVGTYIFGPQGTFTLTINNLPIPALPPGVPNTFGFDGVLANNGTQAKLTLSSVSVGGQALPNIGSVITGELIKQYH